MPKKPTIVTPEVCEMASILLGQKLPKHAVRSVLENQFKITIEARSFKRILASAYALLRAADNKTVEQLRMESKRTYEGIISDPMTNARDRAKAQEALDKLYGLVIHVIKHTGTGKDGAIKTENATSMDLSKLGLEDLQALKAIRQKAAAASAGGE